MRNNRLDEEKEESLGIIGNRHLQEQGVGEAIEGCEFYQDCRVVQKSTSSVDMKRTKNS